MLVYSLRLEYKALRELYARITVIYRSIDYTNNPIIPTIQRSISLRGLYRQALLSVDRSLILNLL